MRRWSATARPAPTGRGLLLLFGWSLSSVVWLMLWANNCQRRLQGRSSVCGRVWTPSEPRKHAGVFFFRRAPIAALLIKLFFTHERRNIRNAFSPALKRQPSVNPEVVYARLCRALTSSKTTLREDTASPPKDVSESGVSPPLPCGCWLPK